MQTESDNGTSLLDLHLRDSFPTSRLERSPSLNHTNRHRWCRTPPRILHLAKLPQGWDRFMSPSVCKLCGCNGINYSQGKVRGFLCTKVSQTDTYIIHLLDTGHSGIRDSLITHTLGYHNPPRRYENSPFSYLNCTLAGKHH